MKWAAVLVVVAIAIDGLPALNLPQDSSSDPGEEAGSAIDIVGVSKAGRVTSPQSDTSSETNSDFSQNQLAEEETSHKDGATINRKSPSEYGGGTEESDESSSHEEYSQGQGGTGSENQGLLSEFQARSSLAQRGPIRHFSHIPNHGIPETQAYNQHKNYASENGHYGSRTRNHGGSRRHIGHVGTHNSGHRDGYWNHPYNSEQVPRGTRRHRNKHFVSGTGNQHQGASSAEYIDHAHDGSQFSEDGYQGADTSQVHFVDSASNTENQETNSGEYDSGNVSDESESSFESSGYVDKSFLRGLDKRVNNDQYESEPDNEGDSSGQDGFKAATETGGLKDVLKRVLNKHFINPTVNHSGKYNAISRHGNGYQVNANGDLRGFHNRLHFGNQRVNPGYDNFAPTDNVNYGPGNGYHSTPNDILNRLLNRARDRLSYPGPVNPRPVPGKYINGGFAQGGYNDQYDIANDEEESQDANAKYLSDILTQAQDLLKHRAVPNSYDVTPAHHHPGPQRRPVYDTPNLGIRFYDAPTGSYMATPASTADDDDTYGGVAPEYVVPAVIVPEFNGYPNGQYYGPNYYRNGGFGSEPSYIPSIDRSVPTTIFGRNPSVLPLSKIPVSDVANIDNAVVIDRALTFEPLPPLHPFKSLPPLTSLTPLTTLDTDYEGTSRDASEIIKDKDLLKGTFESASNLKNDLTKTVINNDLTSKITHTIHPDSDNDGNSEIDNGTPTDKTALPKQTGKPVKDNEKLDEAFTTITNEKTDDNKLVTIDKDDDKTIINPDKPIIIDKNTVTKHIYNHDDDSKKDKTVKSIEKILETSEKSEPIENKDDGTIKYDKSNEKTTTKKDSVKDDKQNSNDNYEISKPGKSFVIDKTLVINSINKDESGNGKESNDQTSTKTRETSGTESKSETLDKSDEGTTTNGNSIVIDESTVIKLTGKDLKDLGKNDKTVEQVKRDLEKDGSHVIGKPDEKTTKPVKSIVDKAIVIQNQSVITDKDSSTKNGKTSDKTTEIRNAVQNGNVTDKKDKTLAKFDKSDNIGKINVGINKKGKSTVTDNTDNQGKDNIKRPKTDANVEKALETDDKSKPVHNNDDDSIKNGKSNVIGKTKVIKSIHKDKSGTETIDETSTETKEVVGNDGKSDSNENNDYETIKNSKSKENKGLKDSDKKSKTVEKIKKQLGTQTKPDDFGKKDKTLAKFDKSDNNGKINDGINKKGKSKVTDNTDSQGKDNIKRPKTDANVEKVLETDDTFKPDHNNDDDSIKNGKSNVIGKTKVIKRIHKDKSGTETIDETSTVSKEVVGNDGKSDSNENNYYETIKNSKSKENKGLKDSDKKSKTVEKIKKQLGKQAKPDDFGKDNDGNTKLVKTIVIDKDTVIKNFLKEHYKINSTRNDDNESTKKGQSKLTEDTDKDEQDKNKTDKTIEKIDEKKYRSDAINKENDNATENGKSSDNKNTTLIKKDSRKHELLDIIDYEKTIKNGKSTVADKSWEDKNEKITKKVSGTDDEFSKNNDSDKTTTGKTTVTKKSPGVKNANNDAEGGKSRGRNIKSVTKNIKKDKSSKDDKSTESDKTSQFKKNNEYTTNDVKKNYRNRATKKDFHDDADNVGTDKDGEHVKNGNKNENKSSKIGQKVKKEVESDKSDDDSIKKNNVDKKNDQHSRRRSRKGGKSGRQGSIKDKKEVKSDKGISDSINEDSVDHENDQPSRPGKGEKSPSNVDYQVVGSKNDGPRTSDKDHKSESKDGKKKRIEGSENDDNANSNETYSKGGKTHRDDDRNVVESQNEDALGRSEQKNEYSTKTDKIEGWKNDHDSDSENIGNDSTSDEYKLTGITKETVSLKTSQDDNTNGSQDQSESGDDSSNGTSYLVQLSSSRDGVDETDKDLDKNDDEGDYGDIENDDTWNDEQQENVSEYGDNSNNEDSEDDDENDLSGKSDDKEVVGSETSENKDSNENYEDASSRSAKSEKSGPSGGQKENKGENEDAPEESGEIGHKNQDTDSSNSENDETSKNVKLTVIIEKPKTVQDETNDGVNDESKNKDSNDGNAIGQSVKGTESKKNNGQQHKIITKIGTIVVNKTGHTSDESTKINENQDENSGTKHDDSSIKKDFDANDDDKNKKNIPEKRKHKTKHFNKIDNILGQKNDHKTESTDSENNETSQNAKSTGNNDNQVSDKTNHDESNNAKKDEGEHKIKKVVKSGTKIKSSNNDDDNIMTGQSGKGGESVGKDDKNDTKNLGSDNVENGDVVEDGSVKSEKEIKAENHKKTHKFTHINSRLFPMGSHKFVGRKVQKKYQETDLINNDNSETSEEVKSTEINEKPVSNRPGQGKNKSDKKAATERKNNRNHDFENGEDTSREGSDDDDDESKLGSNGIIKEKRDADFKNDDLHKKSGKSGNHGRNGSSQDEAVGHETGDSKTPNEHDDDELGVDEEGERIHGKKHRKSHKIVRRKGDKKNHETDFFNIDNTATSKRGKSTDINKKTTSYKLGQEQNKNDENERTEKNINRNHKSENGEDRENSDDDEDELSKNSGKGTRRFIKKIAVSDNDDAPKKCEGGKPGRHGGKQDKTVETENGNKEYFKEHDDDDKGAAEKSYKGGRISGNKHKKSYKVLERKGHKNNHVTDSADNENDGFSKQVILTVDDIKPVSNKNSEDQKNESVKINKEEGSEKGHRLTNEARDGETNEDGKKTEISDKKLRIRDNRKRIKNNVKKTKKDLQSSIVNGSGPNYRVGDGGEHITDSKLIDQNTKSVNRNEKHKIGDKIVKSLQNRESGDHSDSETTKKSKSTSNSEKAITEETDNSEKNYKTSTTNEDETSDDSNSAVKDKISKTKKHNDRHRTTNNGNKDTHSSQVIRKHANTKDKERSKTYTNTSNEKISNEKDSSSDSKNNSADDNEIQDNEFEKESANNSNEDKTTDDLEQEDTTTSSENDDAISQNTSSEREDTSDTKNTAVTNASKAKPKIQRRTTDIATKTRNFIKRKDTADSTSGKTTETGDGLGKNEEISNRNTADNNSSDNYSKEKSSSTSTVNRKEKSRSQSDESSISSTKSEVESKTSSTDTKNEKSGRQSDESSSSSANSKGKSKRASILTDTKKGKSVHQSPTNSEGESKTSLTDNKIEKSSSQSDESNSSSANSEGESKTASTDTEKETSDSQSEEFSSSSNETADRQSKDETKSKSYKYRKEESSNSASGYGSGGEQKSSKDGKKTTHKKSSEDSAHSKQQQDSKYTEESSSSEGKTVQSGQKSASDEAHKNSSDSYIKESDGKTKKSKKDSASAEDEKNEASSSY